MALETAQAGTLESSDCLVTVGPAEGRILDVRGGNAKLFAERTRRVVDAVLARYGLKDVRVQIQDQGALEATLTARVETALDRALGKEGGR